MKSLCMKSLAPLPMMLLACLVIFSPTFVQSTEIFTETLAYETQRLNLDSGAVIDATLPGEEDADISFAYNALRSPNAVMLPADTEGIEFSYLWGTAFDSVTTETLVSLTFSTEIVDESFSAGDTFVVRTDTGAVFKLGNAFESEAGVTFDYSVLE